MNAVSTEEKLKRVKSAAKLNAKGSMTITLNGRTIQTEDVYILDAPDNSLVGFIGDGDDLAIVQFSTLTEPGAYNLKEHRIWIYLAFDGLIWDAETGDLTLEVIELKSKYKGHFDIKTLDHRKVDGVFDVRKV
ncbi:hypothetical protein [Pseudomonas sp. Pdm06]|uniref:hypothetical protein n=1 Tax=Pseudomonas sp. Pdm06 TaxID=1790044 RepID=UPI0017876B07|nr:hypothetical protein [Pseudomonas sp. Pdm06]MBD9463663.1 hypothetical protein [Pseudomonas sp. Pdm06]